MARNSKAACFHRCTLCAIVHGEKLKGGNATATLATSLKLNCIYKVTYNNTYIYRRACERYKIIYNNCTYIDVPVNGP
jgi:hypothetical protein